MDEEEIDVSIESVDSVSSVSLLEVIKSYLGCFVAKVERSIVERASIASAIFTILQRMSLILFHDSSNKAAIQSIITNPNITILPT